MQILVINGGSSSIKFSFFDAGADGPVSVFEGEVSGIGGAEGRVAFRDAAGHDLAHEAGRAKIGSMEEAVRFVARAVMQPEVPKIDAIGYRVVHPGAKLKGHQRITDEVLEELRRAAVFAPLHDPAAVTLIETMRRQFPEAAHVACFDTVFHETMPEAATTYALPGEYGAQGVRRYGFHGLSCESIVAQMRAAGGVFPRRLAIAHLGGGCSVTAVLEGRSVDTSMGLTPTGGVVMATRVGDLDPGVMLYLLRAGKGEAGAVEKVVNNAAGLAAFSGTGDGDMRPLREAASGGDERARLGLRVFTRSVRKALGSSMALMGGLDAMAFAGGIGEHDGASRAEILAGMEELGIAVDAERNGASGEGMRRVSTDASKTAVWVVPAAEDRMIAVHVAAVTQGT